MTKRALITGVNGQDGSYLAELLLGQGYRVIGLDRRPPPRDLPSLAALDRHLVVDLLEPGALEAAIRQVRPDELYHLAAHHFSSQTDENRTGRLEPFLRVNLMAPSEGLEFIATELPSCRFFYAASAQVFGAPASSPQNELTPRNPDTPYGISKGAGMDVCRYFRAHRGVFTSVGILYNHESPRRGESFITTQIARAAALASVGLGEHLSIRDLDAIVDWGAAQDYVRAMWLALQQSTSGDYVIASGTGRTVRDFAQAAFAVVRLRASDHLTQESPPTTSTRVPLVGNSSKIREICGWEPAISFDELVRSMVETQMQRLAEGTPS
jgi:GDPmannose 4,6-dehydratase